MRNGGNRRLKDLLAVYEVDIKKNKIEKVYSSKLLDFYRKLLKCEIFKDKAPIPPSKENALNSINDYVEENKTNNENNKDNKYKSVSSDNDKNDSSEDKGFMSHLNNWMDKAYTTTSGIAYSVKDTITESKFGSSMVEVGSSSLNFIKGSGEAVINKGTEVAVSN